MPGLCAETGALTVAPMNLLPTSDDGFATEMSPGRGSPTGT